MKRDHENKGKLPSGEKLRIASITGLFAAIGAVLGMIAYHQQWLG